MEQQKEREEEDWKYDSSDEDYSYEEVLMERWLRERASFQGITMAMRYHILHCPWFSEARISFAKL